MPAKGGTPETVRPRKRHTTLRTLQFHKLVRAPLPFVFRWCTDYREDDDRITSDIYQYRARIVLREPDRIVRIITVPGHDRNRSTDVEIISLQPPDRWHLYKFSVTDDKRGRYRLTPRGPNATLIQMHFREKWKVRNPPSRARYRALFNRVWDRYVSEMERDYRRRP
jgi:hypothetical protein